MPDPNLLSFNPWSRFADPATPWPWLVEQLGEDQRISLARVALQMNKAILQAQVAALDQAIAIVGKQ